MIVIDSFCFQYLNRHSCWSARVKAFLRPNKVKEEIPDQGYAQGLQECLNACPTLKDLGLHKERPLESENPQTMQRCAPGTIDNGLRTSHSTSTNKEVPPWVDTNVVFSYTYQPGCASQGKSSEVSKRHPLEAQAETTGASHSMRR